MIRIALHPRDPVHAFNDQIPAHPLCLDQSKDSLWMLEIWTKRYFTENIEEELQISEICTDTSWDTNLCIDKLFFWVKSNHPLNLSWLNSGLPYSLTLDFRPCTCLWISRRLFSWNCKPHVLHLNDNCTLYWETLTNKKEFCHR